MAEETSGELRIMAIVSRLAKSFDDHMELETAGDDKIMATVAKLIKDVEDVRTIVTSTRAEESDLLESHEAEIRQLKSAVDGHEKELLDLHNQMARVIRELTVGNITAERNEKKLDRILILLEKK